VTLLKFVRWSNDHKLATENPVVFARSSRGFAGARIVDVCRGTVASSKVRMTPLEVTLVLLN
jgi:hypothetical protein